MSKSQINGASQKKYRFKVDDDVVSAFLSRKSNGPYFIAQSEDIVSVAETARILKVHRITIYRWADKDIVDLIELGGTKFVPKSEVERLLKEKEMAPGV